MALMVEKTTTGHEYKVKDMSQADFGCLEIDLTEVDMLGLMSCHTEFGPSQTFKGARISSTLHVTIQTTVLIETLTALSAEAEEEYKKTEKLPDPSSTDNAEFHIVLGLIRDMLKVDPKRYTEMKERLVGVSEETTTGVKRLY